MGHLRAFANARILDLHECAGLRVRLENRSGAKVTERPYEGSLTDYGVDDDRVRKVVDDSQVESAPSEPAEEPVEA